MTMFAEPLQGDTDASLSSQLMTLYDAYCEFHSYCAFVHQAHSGIAAQAEGLDEETVAGIQMSGRCLELRSLQIKEQLRKVLLIAQEAEKKDKG